MKGFLACVLASVPRFVARHLTTPIILAFSCEEEIGCKGVVPLVKELAQWTHQPRLAIIGEPSRMGVIKAHKGNITFETEVIGVEAHSSTPLSGVNAIVYAAKIVTELERIAADLRIKEDPEFSPPYSTLHVGLINGGTVKNIVPGRCKIVWEIRPLPNADLEKIVKPLVDYCDRLVKEMNAANPITSIHTRQTNSVPPLISEEGSLMGILMANLASTNFFGTASYATEAGHFRSANVPAFICGPGDIAQAHKPDEFIETSEIAKCVNFLSRLSVFCEGAGLS